MLLHFYVPVLAVLWIATVSFSNVVFVLREKKQRCQY